MENLGYDHPLENEMLRKTIAAHVQQYKQIEADSRFYPYYIWSTTGT